MSRAERTRVTHVIGSLEVGGAELFLADLVQRIKHFGVDSEVIALTTDGPVGDTLRDAGVTPRVLGSRRNPVSLLARMAALRRHIRDSVPDVVQTWSYLPDVVAGAISRISLSLPVVWNLRHTDLSWTHNGAATLLSAAAAVPASYIVPTRIIAGSSAAARVHKRIGYANRLMAIIPNGVDTQRFGPDEAIRRRMRAELGIADHELLIGTVGRFHPQKGHAVLFRALALIDLPPHVRIVVAGRGTDSDDCRDLARECGAPRVIQFLGEHRAPHDLYRALDVFVNPSIGEGFPNSLAEACAAGNVVIATDAGDSRDIVADRQRIVPTHDVASLAGAIRSVIAMPPHARAVEGHDNREHILRGQSRSAIAAEYVQMYHRLARRRRG